jgi:ABC-type lipoprotein release transport system permease subunit
MVLVAWGMCIGLAGSVAATQVLANRWRGIEPLDPWTYAGVFALMLAAGTGACIAPAYRAAKVDPLEAIRCE